MSVSVASIGRLSLTAVTVCLLAGMPAHAETKGKPRLPAPQDAKLVELEARLDALARQNAALQAQIDQLQAVQNQVKADAVAADARAPQLREPSRREVAQEAELNRVKAVAQDAQETARSTAAHVQSGWAADTTVSAYGEIGYSRPSKSIGDTNVDVQRAVIGMQHRFDDRTKFVGEWEWEHAIVSSGDSGESEIEQLWLEREFDNGVRGRAGLFLMPVGLINQNHEPTAYFGVYRPDVDTKIIPSTWREVGLGLSGDTTSSLSWDVALTTVPNLSKWAPESTEGRDRGPLQSIHGEGQFAAARTLGGVAALNWRGVTGLLLGGSVVYDDIGQHQPGFLGNGAKLLLLDAHARYQAHGWDLAAEYVRGTISHTEALNESYLETAAVDLVPTLVPHLFYGGYVQAAYSVWQRDDYNLLPFARYEVLNTAANFGRLGDAPAGARNPIERIATLGASFRIGEGIVLKADYRFYKEHQLPDPVDHFTLGNSFNLGAGFSF